MSSLILMDYRLEIILSTPRASAIQVEQAVQGGLVLDAPE